MNPKNCLELNELYNVNTYGNSTWSTHLFTIVKESEQQVLNFRNWMSKFSKRFFMFLFFLIFLGDFSAGYLEVIQENSYYLTTHLIVWHFSCGFLFLNRHTPTCVNTSPWTSTPRAPLLKGARILFSLSPTISLFSLFVFSICLPLGSGNVISLFCPSFYLHIFLWLAGSKAWLFASSST